MTDDRDNVVRFRPRPKRPAPTPPPKPYCPNVRRPSGQPAVNWSKAPKAAALIVIVLLFFWLVGGLADWISRIGLG